MLFVIHALDKKGEMPTRAKHYRDHRIHLDRAEDYGVDVITAGTLLSDDGETPCGSIFVIEVDAVVSDAIADADETRLREVAVPWAQSEEFDGRADPADLAEFETPATRA